MVQQRTAFMQHSCISSKERWPQHVHNVCPLASCPLSRGEGRHIGRAARGDLGGLYVRRGDGLPRRLDRGRRRAPVPGRLLLQALRCRGRGTAWKVAKHRKNNASPPKIITWGGWATKSAKHMPSACLGRCLPMTRRTMPQTGPRQMPSVLERTWDSPTEIRPNAWPDSVELEPKFALQRRAPRHPP